MRTTKKIGVWMMIGGTVFALIPVVIVLLGQVPALLANCEVNEAYVQPCIFLGMDIGGPLAGMLMLGWFALITIPVGGGVAVLGLLLFVLSVVVKALQRRRQA